MSTRDPKHDKQTQHPGHDVPVRRGPTPGTTPDPFVPRKPERAAPHPVREQDDKSADPGTAPQQDPPKREQRLPNDDVHKPYRGTASDRPGSNGEMG